MGTVTIGSLWFPRLVSQWVLGGEGTFPHPTSSSIWLSGELSLPRPTHSLGADGGTNRMDSANDIEDFGLSEDLASPRSLIQIPVLFVLIFFCRGGWGLFLTGG